MSMVKAALWKFDAELSAHQRSAISPQRPRFVGRGARGMRRASTKPTANCMSNHTRHSCKKPPQNAITNDATTTCERRRWRQNRVAATCAPPDARLSGSAPMRTGTPRMRSVFELSPSQRRRRCPMHAASIVRRGRAVVAEVDRAEPLDRRHRAVACARNGSLATRATP